MSGEKDLTSTEIFIGRQPIFDRTKNVIAYELLFRDSNINAFTGTDGDTATNTVIANTFMKMGLDAVTGGKRAFINFTANSILQGIPHLLPANFVCVELLETIVPTPEIIKACFELKKKGYMLALDDFVLQPEYEDGMRTLIEMSDVIKVDLRSPESLKAREIVAKQAKTNVRYLAEKVENLDEFKVALDTGYGMFQGYFFSKPTIIARKDIPVAQLAAMQLLQEVTKPEPDMAKMEQVIKRDVALTMQLLRYMNSAAFSMAAKIQSIQHALRLLGPREIGKWATLVTMRNLASSKPLELATLAVVRARFCELLALKLKKNKQQVTDYFLMGLFSLLDAFVDRPLEDVLKELPIPNEISDALCGKESSFRDIYEIVVGYERSDWSLVDQYSAKLENAELVKQLPSIYKEAIVWEKNLSAG